MSDTCGQKWPECARFSDPDGFWLKTWRGLSQQVINWETGGGFSEAFCETWPRSATMRNGIVYRLRALARVTYGIGSGSSDGWPTPSANEDAAGSLDGKMQFMLPHAVKLSDPEGAAAGGQLNPEFVEWLMGYPVGWTEITA